MKRPSTAEIALSPVSSLPLFYEQKTMELWFIALLFCSTSAFDPYSFQPKFATENGHLVISSAEDANITLRTKGSGRVNINDEDLSHLISSTKNAASRVLKFETEDFNDLQRSFKGLTNTVRYQVIARLNRLENMSPNSSSPDVPSRRAPGLAVLNRKVNRLMRIVRVFRTLLLADECDSSPCQHGGTCRDLFNNFHCTCPDQWEGSMCELDVDECVKFRGTGLGCQNGATCQNTAGSYTCLCATGWFGLHCTRRTYDCTTQNSAEMCGHGVCVNQGGTGRGFTCICDQGWTSPIGGGACTVDIDECSAKVSPCSHDPAVPCINLPGSFQCGQCPHGFSGNGYQCADIDECQKENGGCSTIPFVQCINTRGSRICGPCPPGYSGDGQTCTPVSSLCEVNNGGCHSMATCIHNPGLTYVRCKCPYGWSGSGVGENSCVRDPNAVDPCLGSPCKNSGTCYRDNSPSGFHCGCLPSYSGFDCGVSNPCQVNPCLNGGTCTSSNIDFPRYYCRCPASFSGEKCEFESGCSQEFMSSTGSFGYRPGGNNTLHLSKYCRWKISTPNKNLVLRLNITVESECTKAFIKVHDKSSESAGLTGTYCGMTKPESDVLNESSVTVIFTMLTDELKPFWIEWDSVKPACGGFVNASTHGVLKSPGSPGQYRNNLDCSWWLRAPSGRRIQLTFFSMDIEKSNDCYKDRLTVRDGGDSNAPVIESLCNNTLPHPLVSSSNLMFLNFRTDDATSGAGFQLSYTLIEGIPGCGGVLNILSGRITPPMAQSDAEAYAESLNCEWKIQLPSEEKIRIHFVKLNIEDSKACQYDHIAVYDGRDTDAKLVGRYCGTEMPSDWQSSSNVVTIVFKSDLTYNEGSFAIDFRAVCGGHFTSPTGVLKSPYYPEHYPKDRECEYLIEAPPGNAISFQMLDMDLESSPEETCFYDMITIYDGDTTSSPEQGVYCGNGSVGSFVSTHNFLLLTFVSDSTRQGRGFYANYSFVPLSCGGIYKGESGTIATPPQLPFGSVCKYIISAPPGKFIELVWMEFNTVPSISCIRGSVKIYENGVDPSTATQLGESYCGSSKPPSMTSSSNIVMILMAVQTYKIFDPSFKLFYHAVDGNNSCGGNYFSTTGRITSPRYPNNYPLVRTCVWTITIPNGYKIELNIEDFLLENSHPCNVDYLEIRNGGYDTSPLIGRFCGEKYDKKVLSMGNQLYLKFVSDTAITFKGFSLSWNGATAGCGGTLTGSSGSIISPNYPQPYGRNAECYWSISVSHGSAVIISLADIDLEENRSCYSDYIEFFDGKDKRAPSLGRFCSKNHPAYITASTNHVFIKFRSDFSRQGRGFHLTYKIHCNRTITGFKGVIESPNFPNTEVNKYNCLWKINVPTGNKISLVFSYFSLISKRYYPSFRDPNCTDVSLEITESSEASPATNSGNTLGKFCGEKLPPPLNSTLNWVSLHLSTTLFLTSFAFRVEWKIVGCGGMLTDRTALFESPNYPNSVTGPLVCEWLITAPYDKSISIHVVDLHLEESPSCIYDYLEIYNGPDDSGPQLTKMCHKASSAIVSASGNNAFVRFVVDSSYSGKGFSAMYSTDSSGCGGLFTAPSGQIHSKNYPQNYDSHDDCEFRITVDPSQRINLTFTDFDVYSNLNCTRGFVAVYDGVSARDKLLTKICGNLKPGPILSSGNELFVRHNAAGYTSKGFIASYQPTCGAIIQTNSEGTLRIDDGLLSKNVLDDEWEPLNCSWVIKSTNLDDKISLTFSLVDVGVYFTNSSKLEIYAGDDLTSPLVNSFTLDHSPPTVTVPSSSVTLHYVGFNYNLYRGKVVIDYSIYASRCGGSLRSENGYIVSPGYPNVYPVNAECVWTIEPSEGNRVTLQVEEMQIETNLNCNEDYLEVREDSGNGKLIGAYCGDRLPGPITANTTLWIKFKSSPEGAAKGFKAHYTLVHGNELSGTSGIIASPLYPEFYNKPGMYSWRITVKSGKAIQIDFFEVDNELINDNMCRSILKVFDGYDAEAPLLSDMCGDTNPEPFTSSSNVVFIYLGVFSGMIKFRMEWNEVRRGFSNKGNTTVFSEETDCYTKVFLSTSNTTDKFSFQSPGYPYGYAPNTFCKWIFETNPDYHVKIKFKNVELEPSRACSSDNVKIYSQIDGSMDKWMKLGQFCKRNDSQREIEGTNLVKVEFQTDAFVNKTGFLAEASAQCGGSLTDPDGVISLKVDSFGFPKLCQWNVTVKPGKTIKIKFKKFNFPTYGTSGCASSYLMLRDGGSKDSPLLGAGKYCGYSINDTALETKGNRLHITAAITIGLGMELLYESKSRICDHDIWLSTNGISSMSISSPNYPNIPPPHTECVWKFLATGRETIHFDVTDRFDLAADAMCTSEYLELRDGSTAESPLIKRYCSTTPSYVVTEGNALYVKYFTDLDAPSNGFNATVSLGKCGGTIHAKYDGPTIFSPGYPLSYDPYLNCTWRLKTDTMKRFKLKFPQFNLGKIRNLDSSNCNESAVDTLTISEMLPGNEIGRSRVFCGLKNPGELETAGNDIFISFRSQAQPHFSKKRLFAIEYETSYSNCGGLLTMPEGELHSPNYPDSKGVRDSVFCSWDIVVPKGKRVTVTALDFELGEGAGFFNKAHFFNDLGLSSKIAEWSGTKPNGTTVESSDNKMAIFYTTLSKTFNRAFKLRYSSHKLSGEDLEERWRFMMTVGFFVRPAKTGYANPT